MYGPTAANTITVCHTWS